MLCASFATVLQKWISTSISIKTAKTLIMEDAKQLTSLIWTLKEQLAHILNPSGRQTLIKHSLRFFKLTLKYCVGLNFVLLSRSKHLHFVSVSGFSRKREFGVYVYVLAILFTLLLPYFEADD